MSNYFVFTDEAGAYKKNPSESHIRSHPFYIRANVRMSIDDYRKYQIAMQRVAGMYEIPLDEEIKWSDLWRKNKDNPRSEFISKLSPDRLKGYYRKGLETATALESTEFMFTVSDMYGKTCGLKEETVYSFHLQDAFQRVQMDMGSSGFSTFIMDELNVDVIRQIKSVCHELTVKGDYFLKYKNIYQGILIENSLYSPGIQLADYAAGILNGYIRGKIISHGGYQYATDLFNEFVLPRLRSHASGGVVGYGIIDIPKNTAFRSQLEMIFPAKKNTHSV